jgi:hypothetical protein
MPCLSDWNISNKRGVNQQAELRCNRRWKDTCSWDRDTKLGIPPSFSTLYSMVQKFRKSRGAYFERQFRSPENESSRWLLRKIGENLRQKKLNIRYLHAWFNRLRSSCMKIQWFLWQTRGGIALLLLQSGLSNSFLLWKRRCESVMKIT